MSPILFYGVPEGCSFGSIVALEWLGEPYRLCRIQMPEEVSSERFAPVNPVRETPTLLTGDGRLVSESVAILNHIAARGIGRGLGFAQGDPAFDHFNQVLAFLNTSLFSAFAPLWYALETEGEPAAHAALRAYGSNQVAKAHRHIEAMLADRDWLGGDRPGLVDAYFAGIARWNDYHKVVDRADYPRVARLYERLQDDPAVRFAHAIEEQREARTTGGFRGHVSLDEALGLAAAA
jgi:glutathione S-transferase